VQEQGKARHPALPVLLGVAFESIRRLTLPPIPSTIARGPNWIAYSYNLGAQHPHIVAATIVGALLVLLRSKWLSSSDRFGVFLMIGAAATDIFV
jgi:hypothetical protein